MNAEIATQDSTSVVHGSVEYLSTHQIIIIPLLLLVIIYALKYFFGNNFNKKSVLEFVLEFPVDFGFIGITFVLTYFFLDVKSTVFGQIMILVCILIAIVNSTLRRLALNQYFKETTNDILIGVYGVVNTTLSISFMWYILTCINLK